MKIVRSSLVSALSLVVGLALLAPVPAHAQRNGNLQVTQFYYGAVVPATDQQQVRVTVGNPYFAAPNDGDPEASGRYLIELRDVKGDVEETHTIAPGTVFKYVIDPRVDGVLIDPRTRLWHVNVSFQVVAQVVDGQRAPQPSITIELVHARTGEVQSFLAFPGFAGGVSVAAGDVN
jgi:hypothetical protein